MELWSDSFGDGARIPEAHAYCRVDPQAHAAPGYNRNPHLAWSGLPERTRSLALIMHDSDAPTVGDDVNKEGRTVPEDVPRGDFFHWVLVDLAPDAAPIEDGEFSDGVTPRGKSGPEGPRGTRQGINDYTGMFGSDAAMAGDYYGYDGPCPPWNESIPHRYLFTLYALDVDRVAVDGKFTGSDVRAAIEGHVLDQAVHRGTYALNPTLIG